MPFSLPPSSPRKTEPRPKIGPSRPSSFDGKNIRLIEVDGEPYWVAKDVAEALDYPAASIRTIHKLIGHVPDEWKGRNRIPTLGGTQELATLSEQGLYFFVARSDKPNAIPFQKWIAGEVLPAIRKTGQYSIRNGAHQLEHKDASQQESSISCM